jgi:hypothetical protein
MKKTLLALAFGFFLNLNAQTPFFQNSNENIWSAHSVVCTTSGPETIHNNNFLRVFDTDNFGIQDTAFFVYIEMAVETCSGGAYSLIGRVYKLDGVLQYANMTLIADDTAATYPDSALYRMKIPFDQGYALPGDTVVTEVFAPINGAISFFPGSNPYVESGPSYLSAPGCAFPEPTTFASIGYPAVKLILKLWVNQKPQLNNMNVYVFKDGVYDFNKADFDLAMNDYDSDTINLLRVQTLPVNGVLAMNGLAVSVGDTVLSHQIDSLSYTPTTGYSGADSFTLQVKDGYHWANATSLIDIDVMNWQLGTGEELITNSLVYPNPVSDVLTISLNDPIKSYKILDASGKEIAIQMNQNNQINVSELPAGTYFFVVETEAGTAINQFVKL